LVLSVVAGEFSLVTVENEFMKIYVLVDNYKTHKAKAVERWLSIAGWS
jgi:hypothetical protein